MWSQRVLERLLAGGAGLLQTPPETLLPPFAPLAPSNVSHAYLNWPLFTRSQLAGFDRPPRPKAQEMLDLIAKLYEIESRVKAIEGQQQRREHLAQWRRSESVPIVAEIKQWLRSTPARKGSSLGLAINYMLERWAALEVFLTRADVPIDNLHTERLIRPIAVGRKNHYGSRSERGTFVAALFYTLIESAELAGIDPGVYLKQAALRAINDPGTVTLPSAMVAPSDQAAA